jgi:hypothetical protein
MTKAPALLKGDWWWWNDANAVSDGEAVSNDSKGGESGKVGEGCEGGEVLKMMVRMVRLVTLVTEGEVDEEDDTAAECNGCGEGNLEPWKDRSLSSWRSSSHTWQW